MSHELIFLIVFFLFIGLILALDLGILGKKKESVSLKQAGLMSFLMVSLAGVFYFLLLSYGDYIHDIKDINRLEYIVHKFRHPVKILPDNFEQSLANYKENLALEFFTGYVVEYALSIDNVFVMMMIFTSFRVSKNNYHRVLIWGILGAIVMRLIFIFVGAAFINKFDWIFYVFGLFLVYTGIKMYIERNKKEEIDIEHHPVVRFINKYFKVHNRFVKDKFWVKIDGVTKITPLFIVLLIIEFTDLIFAVDSIPAIFSVTKDPYIVYFSNIFAIMGLRSMFFVLAGIVDKLRYLKVGLAVLLLFIGLKMLFHHYLDEIGFETTDSLFVILGILGVSVIASLLNPLKKEDLPKQHHESH